MEIKEIRGLSIQQGPSLQRMGESARFQEVLNTKLYGTENITPISPHTRAELLEHSDKLLTLLDSYAIGLGDPQKTLRELSSLVETIQKEAHLLETEAEVHLSETEEIRGVINDLALTANVAAFRFQRGDFL